MNKNEILQYYAKWIEKECGIVYEEHNYFQLQDRLERLSQDFGLKSFEGLELKIKEGIAGDFRHKLIDISTNNETSFFRDQRFFDSLQNSIIPLMIQKKVKIDELKIWSVASSTGQEPYSVAMILAEIAEKINQQPPKIYATDISQRVLAKAGSGSYTELEIKRGLPENLKNKYFKLDEKKNWIISKKIRDIVDFQFTNLLRPLSLSQTFDLILCRNVLIYQRVEAKVEIVKKITERLAPEGVLLLGAGESLLGLSQDYNQVLIDGVAVYSKKRVA